MRKEKYGTSAISPELHGAGGSESEPQNRIGGQSERTCAALGLSPLFLKLVAYVDWQHLSGDRTYFRLVSEIAELLPNDEVALLARYFVPSIASWPIEAHRRVHLTVQSEKRGGAHVSGI